jgi:hypothetical protein
MRAVQKLDFLLFAFVVLVVLTAVQWQGDLSLAFIRARALEIALPEARMMKSSAGMMASGGIYFGQTAVPAGNQKVNTLGIKYSRSEHDGSRLLLTINGNQVKTSIPDWQLIPVAKFADSQYFSCVTLSGKLYDEGKAELIVKNGGRIINYHPAFTETLLGWRLLQMDMLLLYPECVNLPEYDEGGVILGSNEEQFSPDHGKAAYKDMKDFLAELQASTREKHRSWLISDSGSPITFMVVNGTLDFDSKIYFDYWRFKSDPPDMNTKTGNERLDAIRTALKHEFDAEMTRIGEGMIEESEYRKELLLDLQRELPVMIELHASIAKRLYKTGQFELFKNSINSGSLTQLLTGYTTGELVGIRNIAVQIGAFYEVVHMEEYSLALSGKQSLISSINPLAYGSAVTTMEYAAFFRYVKKNFPGEWNKFMTAVSDAKPLPAPETPTVIYPRNNSLITHLVM